MLCISLDLTEVYNIMHIMLFYDALASFFHFKLYNQPQIFHTASMLFARCYDIDPRGIDA